MKVLVTGKGGKAGSWRIRGEQLGGLIGDVVPRVTDFSGYDVVVCVKRICFEKINRPWVWDLVDFYPQPQCTAWTKKHCIDFVRSKIKQHKPSGILYPNQQMKDDIGIDGEVIYHHCRKVYFPPLKKEVKIVGYEGDQRYIEQWRPYIERECNSRGWNFVVNGDLAKADAVVGFRGDRYNGYAQKYWKSNVKIANAHGFGLPFIGASESGYLETATEYDQFVDMPENLGAAFDKLTYSYRLMARSAAIDAQIHIDDCANKLRGYLESII